MPSRRTYRYRCANCGHEFKPPLLVNYLTFSGMGRNPDGTYHTWKSLTCPSCGKRTRAVGIRLQPGQAADAEPTPYESRPGARHAGGAGQAARTAAPRRAQAAPRRQLSYRGPAGRAAMPRRSSAAATTSGSVSGAARTTSISGRLSRNSRW